MAISTQHKRDSEKWYFIQIALSEEKKAKLEEKKLNYRFAQIDKPSAAKGIMFKGFDARAILESLELAQTNGCYVQTDIQDCVRMLIYAPPCNSSANPYEVWYTQDGVQYESCAYYYRTQPLPIDPDVLSDLETYANKLKLQIWIQEMSGVMQYSRKEKGSLYIYTHSSPQPSHNTLRRATEGPRIHLAFSNMLEVNKQCRTCKFHDRYNRNKPNFEIRDNDDDFVAYFEGDSEGGTLWVLFNIFDGDKRFQADPIILMRKIMDKLVEQLHQPQLVVEVSDTGPAVGIPKAQPLLKLPVYAEPKGLLARWRQWLLDRKSPHIHRIGECLEAIRKSKALIRTYPQGSTVRAEAEAYLHQARANLAMWRQKTLDELGKQTDKPGLSKVDQALSSIKGLIEATSAPATIAGEPKDEHLAAGRAELETFISEPAVITPPQEETPSHQPKLTQMVAP